MNFREDAPGLIVEMMGEEAAFGFGIIETVQKEANLVIGQTQPEVLAGDMFDVMSFVNDNQLGVGEDFAAFETDGKV